MNVTLADAEEVWTKKDNKRVELGRILLKGDNIVSILPFVTSTTFRAPRLLILPHRLTDTPLLMRHLPCSLTDTHPTSKVKQAK